jgi:hypothetical protein
MAPMNQDTTSSAPASSPASASPSALPALPDHLSVDPQSPHYAPEVFEHDIGIRFNGKDRSDVEEYCVSEGFIRVASGKTKDRKGRPLLITLKGKVEAYYRQPA